jgi:hypothetical protein
MPYKLYLIRDDQFGGVTPTVVWGDGCVRYAHPLPNVADLVAIPGAVATGHVLDWLVTKSRDGGPEREHAGDLMARVSRIAGDAALAARGQTRFGAVKPGQYFRSPRTDSLYMRLADNGIPDRNAVRVAGNGVNNQSVGRLVGFSAQEIVTVVDGPAVAAPAPAAIDWARLADMVASGLSQANAEAMVAELLGEAVGKDFAAFLASQQTKDRT